MVIKVIWALASLASAVFNVGLTLWALSCVKSQGELLDTVIGADVDVFTISHEGFWGPVHMLVPRNCSSMERTVEQHSERLLSEGRPTADAEKAGNHSKTPRPGFLSDDQHVPKRVAPSWQMPSEIGDYEFVELVQMERCNEAIDEPDPTIGQKYWSMTWSAGFWDDFADIQRTRHGLYAVFSVSIFITVAVENIVSVGMKFMGPPEYSPVGEGMQGKAIQVLGAKFFKLVCWIQQESLCSLFTVYWDKNHYVMSYMPGMAYMWLLISCVVFLCVPLGYSYQQFEIFLRPSLGCLCCSLFFVIIPFVGYQMYLYQFLWQTTYGQGFSHEVISVEYLGLQDAVGRVSQVIFGYNVVEAIITAVIDLILDF